MRFSIFVLIFFVLEVTSIVKVGSLYGASGVIGFLVLGVIVGAVIFNFQSQRTRMALLRGTATGASPLNALSVYLAAVLFIFPGFFSDILAVLLLLPPTRLLFLAGVGQYLMRRLGPRMQRMQRFRVYDFTAGNPFDGFSGAAGQSGQGGEMRRDFADEDVIEGEFRDVTDLRDRDPGCEALPDNTRDDTPDDTFNTTADTPKRED